MEAIFSHLTLNWSPMILLLLGVSAFAGGVMRGFTGFGGGLLMMPVYAVFMPPVDAVAIVAILNLIATIQMLPSVLHLVRWGRLLALGLPTVIFIPLGTMILTSVDPEAMRTVIAIIVIVMSLILLKGWKYHGKRGFFQDLAVGISGGILTGSVGMGGPPIILYLLSSTNHPKENRATFALMFGLSQLASLGSLFFHDMLTTQHVISTAWLFPIYFIATWIGVRCYVQVTGKREHLLRYASLVLLLVIGVGTLFI